MREIDPTVHIFDASDAERLSGVLFGRTLCGCYRLWLRITCSPEIATCDECAEKSAQRSGAPSCARTA